jgi:hypothetical protein
LFFLNPLLNLLLRCREMRWSRLAYSSREEFLSWTSSQLKEAAAAGTLKTERVITSPQRSSVSVAGRSKPLLNFCANNYLGLSAHPKVVAAARSALDTHGFGMSSVRFICGTQDIHKELERRLARFHDMEDAILFGSAFDANGGIFEVLLTGEEDVVISDELNHASIIDGIRLCKATRKRYKHRDTGQLEQLLGEGSGTTRRVLVVTDGVFSMDGTVAPLREIVASAKRSGALVMVDECHATGFLGRGGKGTPTLENSAQPDIISSTLGKVEGVAVLFVLFGFDGSCVCVPGAGRGDGRLCGGSGERGGSAAPARETVSVQQQRGPLRGRRGTGRARHRGGRRGPAAQKVQHLFVLFVCACP